MKDVLVYGRSRLSVFAGSAQNRRVLLGLLLALAFSVAFGQEAAPSLYSEIQAEATTASTALRTAGVTIVGGFVVAIFAISFVRKILAAK